MKLRILGIAFLIVAYLAMEPLAWWRLVIVALCLTVYGGSCLEMGKRRAGGGE